MRLLKRIGLAILLLSLVLYIVYVSNSNNNHVILAETHFYYLPNDTYCPIAHFDDKEIDIRNNIDLCSQNSADWLTVVNNYAIFNATVMIDVGDVNCIYKTISWDTDFQSYLSPTWERFYNNTFLNNNILLVRCKGKSLFFYFEKYLLGFKDEKTTKALNNNAKDIIIIGIDSVSRLAWKRLLKKSHDYLVNSMEESTVIFKKMNVLGDGTTINVLGILAGELEFEVYESRKGYPNAKTVDEYPWIWKSLATKNYQTYYDEDDVKFGTFQYRLLGFNRQPTDFYSRTWRMVHSRRTGRSVCINRRNIFQDQIHNLNSFFQHVKSPKFAFVWSTFFSHDYNEEVATLDKSLTELLKEINRPNGVFNNTILLLMSDHGHRFNSRLHLQGKYEERLPFFSIHLPRSLIKERSGIIGQLRANENKLITTMDAYETLRDIANNFTPPNYNASVHYKMSLFNPGIPYRNCADVKVATHWCSCLKWSEVSVDDKLVKDAAVYMTERINSITVEYRSMCHELKVDRIIRALLIAPSDDVLRFRNTNDGHGRVPNMSDRTKVDGVYYRIALKTKPGDALFESTVHVRSAVGVKTEFSLEDRNIDRSNKYANWIWCIKDGMKDVRKYCLCK